ncbi:MAG TPA: lectin-like protein [Candidatus Omnitrophota bacterium]|nr:lectin-like protein [Candidatus Omnitrophota bacterium]HPS19584.1 lectin-like protein [Candidatus Omnitrophota bacterium]
MKKVNFYIISMILVLSIASVAHAEKKYYNGHWYETVYAVNGGLDQTWDQSRSMAQALGGDLVTINDAAENAWLVENMFSGTHSTMWIGMYRYGSLNEWAWASGDPISYTQLSFEEVPYDMYLGNYVTLFGDGKWGVSVGSYIGAGIAEGAVTPEPASMALFGLGASALAFVRRKKK